MDDAKPSRQLFYLTACISLLAHLVLLLAPWSPLRTPKPPPRLDVRLPHVTPRPAAKTESAAAAAIPRLPATVAQPIPDHAMPRPPATRRAAGKQVMAMPKPAAVAAPKYSQTERDDIDNFLHSLVPANKVGANGQTVQNRPPVAARGTSREPSGSGSGNAISVERIPNSPPVDRTTMQTYIDAVASKLYRNANSIPHPAGTGSQNAAVRLRINADGTLNSVTVLDEGDQKEEVEFTRRLLERSAPYPAFPAAMAASIKVLTISFCIRPSQDSGTGAGRAC